MQKLYYCKGLPGSGKSTLAKEMVANSNGTLVRVNRDDLRKESRHYVRGVFNKRLEREIARVRDERIGDALSRGFDVISDDTNLSERHARHFREIANKYNAELILLDFTDPKSSLYVSLEECIKRDLNRDSSVGKDVILEMYYSNVLGLKDSNQYQPSAPSLGEAIIVDLDGTLCHINGRSHFDSYKYDTDVKDLAIAKLIEAFDALGYNILIVTGREGSPLAISQTKKWLQDNGIKYDLIMFRPEGSNHIKDYEIKKNIYEQYIKDKYQIVFALEDRPRNIRMWRSLGIKVLDCGLGYEF